MSKQQKADNLRKLLEVFNEERLNPTDFANAFQSVISYVKTIQAQIVDHLKAVNKYITDTTARIERENERKFAALESNINDKMAKVKDGYTPQKGVDYFDGEDGEDGKDADEEAIEERIVARFPEIPQPDMAEDIRNKLELLEGEDRLDISAIRGIEDLERRVTAHKVIPTNQGAGISDSSGHIDRFQWLKFPGATITRNADEATITIGASSINFADEEVPSGSGTAFSVAHTPIAGSLKLYRGGTRQQRGGDYSISGANITLFSALQNGEVLLCDYRY